MPSLCVIPGPDQESSTLCLCAFPLCHSWPRPGIQYFVPLCLSSFVPLFLCAFVPSLCVISGPDQESSVRYEILYFRFPPIRSNVIPYEAPASRSVSFLAQTRNPVLCAFVPSLCVIPGPDQESSTLCLCASLPLCLCAFPLCHSWPRLGIQYFVPLCLPFVSFLAQTRNPVLCAFVPLFLCAFVPSLCVIPGPDQESKRVSLRVKPRHPVACHSWPRPGIQGPFRYPGYPGYPLPDDSQHCHSRLDPESRGRQHQETSMNPGYQIIPDWIRDQYDIKGMNHCRRGEQADH